MLQRLGFIFLLLLTQSALAESNPFGPWLKCYDGLRGTQVRSEGALSVSGNSTEGDELLIPLQKGDQWGFYLITKEKAFHVVIPPEFGEIDSKPYVIPGDEKDTEYKRKICKLQIFCPGEEKPRFVQADLAQDQEGKIVSFISLFLTQPPQGMKSPTAQPPGFGKLGKEKDSKIPDGYHHPVNEVAGPDVIKALKEPLIRELPKLAEIADKSNPGSPNYQRRAKYWPRTPFKEQLTKCLEIPDEEIRSLVKEQLRLLYPEKNASQPDPDEAAANSGRIGK
jgi:hypothetical protein